MRLRGKGFSLALLLLLVFSFSSSCSKTEQAKPQSKAYKIGVTKIVSNTLFNHASYDTASPLLV